MNIRGWHNSGDGYEEYAWWDLSPACDDVDDDGLSAEADFDDEPHPSVQGMDKILRAMVAKLPEQLIWVQPLLFMESLHKFHNIIFLY